MIDATEGFLNAEESLAEDLETVQSKIADQLAELSAAENAPTGYKIRGASFDATEVDFASSGWLLRVLRVQVWLHPGSEISPKEAEADPYGAATKFFHEIGADAPRECVFQSDGIVRMTPAGGDYLSTRLDMAIRLQQEFAELVENASVRQASQQWREQWEEGEEEEAAPEPIKAKTDNWRISDFISKANRDLLNLSPSYQRGDVWPTADAQKLMESILRGIPLPSIILLKPRSTERQAQYEVVDGKQRLTSILRFIGQHPKALERVRQADKRHPEAKFVEHFSNDYRKFRRLWKTFEGEALSDSLEAKYYFPFRLSEKSRGLTAKLAGLAGKYYCQIANEEIEVGEGLETVSDVFQGPTAYKIPLIEYLDATPRQIHEVFHLYNRQGKHLNAEEIRNALFHEVDLVRLALVASADNPAVQDLAPYFPEGKHHILHEIAKSLEGYRFGTARYKKTKILTWLFAMLFQPSIENGELAIRSTAKQIDALLGNIRDNPAHWLADRAALVDLMSDTHRCIEIHSSSDCWEGRFKDDERGSKWQELQLVASLVGVFLVGAVEESPSELLDIYRDELLGFTRNHQRPEKTQNKEQWAFIGEVSLGIVNLVGVSEEKLDRTLLSRYGVSCVSTLRAAKALYRPRLAE